MTKGQEFVELYSDSKYEKPSVTVDAVIFRIKSEQSSNYRKLPEKKLQVYLTKRKYAPYIDHYGIVGTFIDLEHELSDTMKLCVKNKVGLEEFYFEQLFTFGEKSRDPRDRVLAVSYLLLTDANQVLTGGEWFDMNLEEVETKTETKQNGFKIYKKYKLTLSNPSVTLENLIEVNNTKENLKMTTSVNLIKNSLAFDHISIIFYALDRLKNKLEYTDIIFNLLPKEFTLTELKQCYELILREKLLDANFRRKIAKMVTPINKLAEAQGHRTSQLFTHNPNWLNVNLE